MKFKLYNLYVFIFCSSLASCSISNENAPGPALIASFIFRESAEGWNPSFSDYEPGTEDSLQLDFRHGAFRSPASADSLTAVIQSGNVLNSDLFMFIKQQIGGLEPETKYLISFHIEMYAQVNGTFDEDLVSGNKGSYLKAGGFTSEPDTVISEDPDAPGRFLASTSFEKGEIDKSGPDMLNMGKLQYTVSGAQPIILYGESSGDSILRESDQDGKMWIAIGVDTNIPVYLSIYYSQVVVQFRKA